MSQDPPVTAALALREQRPWHLERVIAPSIGDPAASPAAPPSVPNHGTAAGTGLPSAASTMASASSAAAPPLPLEQPRNIGESMNDYSASPSRAAGDSDLPSDSSSPPLPEDVLALPPRAPPASAAAPAPPAGHADPAGAAPSGDMPWGTLNNSMHARSESGVGDTYSVQSHTGASPSSSMMHDAALEVSAAAATHAPPPPSQPHQPASSQPLPLGQIRGTLPPPFTSGAAAAPAAAAPSGPLPLGQIRGTTPPPSAAANNHAPVDSSQPLTLGQIRSSQGDGASTLAPSSSASSGPSNGQGASASASAGAGAAAQGAAAWSSPEPQPDNPSGPLTLAQIREDCGGRVPRTSSCIGTGPGAGGLDSPTTSGHINHPHGCGEGAAAMSDAAESPRSREPSAPVTEPLFCVAPNHGFAAASDAPAAAAPAADAGPPAAAAAAPPQLPASSQPLKLGAIVSHAPPGEAAAAQRGTAPAAPTAIPGPPPQPPSASQPLRLSQIVTHGQDADPAGAQRAQHTHQDGPVQPPPASSHPLRLGAIKASDEDPGLPGVSPPVAPPVAPPAAPLNQPPTSEHDGASAAIEPPPASSQPLSLGHIVGGAAASVNSGGAAESALPAAPAAAAAPASPLPAPTASQPLRLSQVKARTEEVRVNGIAPVPRAPSPPARVQSSNVPDRISQDAGPSPPSAPDSRPLTLGHIVTSASGSARSSADGFVDPKAQQPDQAHAKGGAPRETPSDVSPAAAQPPPPASSQPLKLGSIITGAATESSAGSSRKDETVARVSPAAAAEAPAAPSHPLRLGQIVTQEADPETAAAGATAGARVSSPATPAGDTLPPQASSRPLRLGQVRTASLQSASGGQGTSMGSAPDSGSTDVATEGLPSASTETDKVPHPLPASPKCTWGEIEMQPAEPPASAEPPAAAAVAPQPLSAPSQPIKLGQIVTHATGSAAPTHGYTGVIAIHRMEATPVASSAEAAQWTPGKAAV